MKKIRKKLRYSLAVMMILGVSASSHAWAEIYRCDRPDGSVQFTDLACLEGTAQRVEVRENSALDSQRARDNMQAYAKQQNRHSRKEKASPQLILIQDSITAERNDRIASESKKAKKNRKKVRKKHKQTKKDI